MFAAVFNPVASPASPQARALWDLFGITLVVCALIFALVAGLITWILLRYRSRDTSVPAQVHGNTRLEIGCGPEWGQAL